MFAEVDLILTYPFRSKSPLLFDVGAHHGGFARRFAVLGWRIIAFEPEANNRKAFTRNMKEFPDVSCVAKAVSDISGEKVPFFVSDEHYGIHSLKPFHGTHVQAYDVETIRLDDAAGEFALTEITLLKIDTEGADYLAIRSFDFARYRPELVMAEFMDERSRPFFDYSHHDVVGYMTDRGYVAFVSEWAPIKEYGREGVPGSPHRWLQCVPYPLDHEPSWGNLIFVPEEDRETFSVTLAEYLSILDTPPPMTLRDRLRKIPGAGLASRIMSAGWKAR